jgi:hypothetical protein
MSGADIEYSLHHPTARGTYALETEQRMVHAISELQAIMRYETGRIDAVLHLVDQQAEASLKAGFDEVSTLCRGLKDAVTEVRHGERPWQAAAASTLLDACRAIHIHAGSIAKVMLHLHNTRKPAERCRAIKQERQGARTCKTNYA